MIRVWALVLVLVCVCEGTDRETFWNCTRVEFCNTLRPLKLESKEQFAADVAKANITKNVVTIPLFNGNDENLNLQLTLLTEYKVRLKVLEVNHTRFEIPYVLDGEPEVLNTTLTSNENNATLTPEKEDLEQTVVVTSGPPFTVQFYHGNRLAIEFTSERLIMRNTNTSKPITFGLNFQSVSALYGLSHHAFDLVLPQTVNTTKDPVRLRNSDISYYEINDTLGLYGSIPVIYAHSINYTQGVYVHNAAEQWIDLDYGDNVTAYFMLESGTLDLFVLLGPTPRNVVRQYVSLTGKSHMPQIWVFGYHQCRWSYWTQEDAKDVVANMDNYDFPMDVLWLDDGHSNKNRYFEWNPENFSDPIEMQQNISSTGRRIVTILDPHIKIADDYAVYTMAKGKYFVRWPNGSDYEGVCWPGLSSYIDFLDPEASDYYGSWYRYDKFNKSTPTLAGAWNDMNEPSVFNDTNEKTFPFDALHYGDVEHRNLHNMYGFLHVRATHKGLLNRDNSTLRPFILTRSHFAGSQRYAIIWTGDNTAEWPFIRLSYSECLTASILGMPICGADVAGFFDDRPQADEELSQRWYQAAIWLTFFRGHSEKTTARREPYLFSEAAQKVIRHAIKLRYKHIPVYYTLMYQYTIFGDPIIRPLFYHYPSMFGYDDHILIGNNILARPVFEPNATSVTVHLPRGISDNVWYRIDDDSWTSYPAGSVIELPVDITTSPYFYRGGSIILRKDREKRSTTDMVDDPFTAYVNLDNEDSAVGLLYVDDYYSFEYQNNFKFFYARLSYIKETHGLKIEELDGDSEGINVFLSRIVINEPVPADESIKSSAPRQPVRYEHTATADGTPLESINIAKELRKRNGNLIIDL